ncbi:MAG: Hsp20/alpha crystallin family protein [Burkholderiales bacterium]|nr:Hsp20/alpha crystallin family protein [Burkholderiales bacterium]
MPASVDANAARAELANGVLEVTIPKRQGASRKALDVK